MYELPAAICTGRRMPGATVLRRRVGPDPAIFLVSLGKSPPPLGRQLRTTSLKQADLSPIGGHARSIHSDLTCVVDGVVTADLGPFIELGPPARGPSSSTSVVGSRGVAHQGPRGEAWPT